MATYPLGKQTAGYNSPHNWLMSLAVDLATLCGENGTNGCHLAGFNEDIVFACHFMATCPPLPSHPVGVVLVVATPVKNHLKWRKIQLAIHPIVGG